MKARVSCSGAKLIIQQASPHPNLITSCLGSPQAADPFGGKYKILRLLGFLRICNMNKQKMPKPKIREVL